MLRKILFVLCFAFLCSCSSLPKGAYEQGMASWYGGKFHGRKTASGEVYNMHQMTAAHPSLAFGTRVKVVDQRTRRAVVVRITDRGPFTGGRIIDLSKAAAKKLGLIRKGITKVTLYILN